MGSAPEALGAQVVTDITTRPNPKHPAKFSPEILKVIEGLLLAEQRRVGRPLTVFDPLAGTGRIHRLYRDGKIHTYGMEIEPEWAACHQRTSCGDSIVWMENNPGPRYDVICASPPYSNRFSDSHNARDGSKRRSYTHDLGHQLTENNSGNMGWGQAYWLWCARLYRALPLVLKPGGLVLWNVSDFVKAKAVVPAVTWHRGALYGAGFYEDQRPRLIETQRLGYGANREARAPSEVIMRLRYGAPT